MTERIRIFITGASGFVGTHLIRALTANQIEVIGLSRGKGRSEGLVRWVQGISSEPGDWQKEIDGCHGVINLAGEPVVGKRWSPEVKQRIRDSRVKTTSCVVDAIERAKIRPSVLISASAVGLYPKNLETAMDENTPPADDFLGEVCQEWERAAQRVESLKVRLVLLRIGVVLGLEGGALAQMMTPFKFGVGGPVGGGKQWFPWIHIDDVVEMIVFSLNNGQVRGPVNCVAPNPVRMGDFTSELGRALHRPAILPVPGFAVQLLFGESASVVLDGQRVTPAVAEKVGYKFRFPKLDEALRNLIG